MCRIRATSAGDVNRTTRPFATIQATSPSSPWLVAPKARRVELHDHLHHLARPALRLLVITIPRPASRLLQRERQRRHYDVVKRHLIASALIIGACARHEHEPVARREAAPVASVAQQASVPAETAPTTALPSRSQADSLLQRYLTIHVEGQNFPAEQFDGIYSTADPCAEEEYGDGISSYWLARGRVLGYTQAADTLRASLELLTVAAQQPGTESQYASVVTARIRTDTLTLKLVPDSSRRRWQTCGLLSDGFTLGGYGQPRNISYNPPGMTQARLLAQVDSINRVSYRQTSGTVRDSASGRAPLRTHVCAWIDSGAVRPVPRCSDVDSLGRYRIDSVRLARQLLTVSCETLRGPGIDLAFEHLVVADTDLRRDWRVNAVRCDSRPRRQVKGTFRGQYSQGSTANDFLPCRSDAWFLASDSLPDDLRFRRAWVTWPQGSMAQVNWPSAPHDSAGNGQYYVEWRATIIGPGKYGRRGGYPFELQVDSVVIVRPAQRADCD